MLEKKVNHVEILDGGAINTGVMADVPFRGKVVKHD